jgi:hypothetical protein
VALDGYTHLEYSMTSPVKRLLIAGCASVTLGAAACAGLIPRGATTKPRQPQARRACFPFDARTADEIATVKELIAGTDSGSIRVRQFTHLVPVADTAVAAVSDSTICARALTAFNREMDGGPVSQIYLVRAGTMFVASHLPDTTSEFRAHIVMNGSFKVLGGFLR